MKRLPNFSGLFCTMLLALGALAIMAATSAPAQAQGGCGVTVQTTKSCQTTTNVGAKDDCTFKLTNQDACGNTYQINSGSDVIHASGGDVPENGLPISTATPGSPPVGTPCAAGNPPTLPCTLAVNGSVTFHDNNYTVVIGDYNINTTTHKLGDTGTINMTDLCNNNTDGCDNSAANEQATASTTVQINCSVQLDKQISCDYAYWNDPSRGNDPTKTTWNDVGFADGATNGCTAFAGDPIAIRYVAKNNGDIDVDTCSVTDLGNDDATKIVNDFSIPGTLAAGATYDTDAHSLDITTDTNGDPLQCPTSLEPNTATLTCTCIGVTPTLTKSDTDTATCNTKTCDATIDKQVTCQGTTYDKACNDVSDPSSTGCDTVDSTGEGTTAQSTSCVALNGHCSDGSIPTNVSTCTGDGSTPIPCVCATGSFVAGQDVGVTYVITQRGQDGLNTCTATETNGLIVGTTNITSPITGASTTITGGGTPPTVAQTLPFTPECSNPLSAGETSNDTATLNCTCNSLPGNTTVKTITKHDTAHFSCQQAELSLTKSCDYNSTTHADDVSVTATNNSTSANLINCTVSDQYLETTPPGTAGVMCPQNLPLTAGTGQDIQSVTLGGSSTSGFGLLANGGTASWTGTVSNLSADACNNASITCDVEGTSPAVTVSANAQDTCEVPVTGCETRTPGFWKTHPDTTLAVMGNPPSLQSCGLVLNNINAGQDCSAIEDMCSLGQDAAKLGIDPVQANLIFQCAAAELNLAVTLQDGGSCGDTIPGSKLTFDTCCGAGGVCATADTSMLNACQDAVSNFNALFDNTTLTSTSVLSNPGANPDNCQAANGNGFVNDQAGGADCNGSRTYLTKTTGKKAPTNNANTNNNGKALGKQK
jgi:hypothetical protein